MSGYHKAKAWELNIPNPFNNSSLRLCARHSTHEEHMAQILSAFHRLPTTPLGFPRAQNPNCHFTAQQLPLWSKYIAQNQSASH